MNFDEYRKTYIKCRDPNKRRVSIKRRGFEVHLLINAAPAFIRSFTVKLSCVSVW